MKILSLDAYFYPEIIAYTHLETDIMNRLLRDGNDILVLCPVPTRGISDDTAKKFRSIKKETLENGIKVHRFSAPGEKKNPIVRALRYFWCNFRQYSIATKYRDIDAIYAASTPPTQGVLCGKVAKKLSKKYGKKVPFIYNLQDVFPDSLVTTGLTKNGSLIWKIGRRIEDYTYRNADKIIVISESMKKNILEKGVPEEKIVVVSNWIDLEAVKPIAKEENSLFAELNIPKDKFIVLYAGNFGKAQGADVVLEAAEKLKDNDNIQFVIFGGGAGFQIAKEKAENLKNVIINPLLPQERVSEVYSLGDVALITCKKGVGTSGMPSKTWSIMACNTPIIASFDTDSELAEIIEKANSGVCVEPQNADQLANEILSMFNGKASGFTGGREYTLANASKEKCTAKYVETILSVSGKEVVSV